MTRLVAKAVVFIPLIFIFGCATSGVNLVETGNVIVEAVPTEDEHISSTHVYRDDRELVVSGRVYSQGYATLEKGHVDIEIINPDGTPIKQCAHYFSLVRRKEDLTAPFAVHLRPLNLPQSTKVRLTYHHTTSPEEILSKCGD